MRKILSIRAFLFTLVLLAASTASFAQVRISVAFGPPALPVYEQPLCPGDGYIWTPGYWAWDDDDADYYWVPGTWVLAPEVGYLWTPPYWGWNDGAYVFYDGYWGPHVGFYGGVNYGFGYFGVGFVGGRWDGDRFFYNRAVMHVDEVNIRNVYNERVNEVTVNRVSYNGGPGGIEARPRPEEEAAARERHLLPVSVQAQHMQSARTNPELRASTNHGKPSVAATARPGEFRSGVPAREAGGAYNPPANRRGGPARGESASPGASERAPAIHPKDLPPFDRSSSANSDKKYQQQQEKMYAKQDQERQKLQQKQDQEHQRMESQSADAAGKQQMEQRHQQQTQQLQQRHVQQQQRMQGKQQSPHH